MSYKLSPFTGNLTADPALNYTVNGDPVVNVTVAHNPRRKDETTGEWVDARDPVFYPVTVWGNAALNIAETLRSGDPVVVIDARPSVDTYTKDGQTRTRIVHTAKSILPDLQLKAWPSREKTELP
ncbi:Single-strand binding protein family protein [Micrococcales bacterium KH10]|nr:Single-strand binding protein family protein [Micrococcales bacterium KH10]